MTIGPATMCYVCEYFEKEDGKIKCKVFKEGIPREIFFEYFDHRKPFPGDNGVQFKLKEGEEFPEFYDWKNKD